MKSGPWRVAAASVVGTSHLASGLSCQDRHFVAVLGDSLLVACVADGAGSASMSAIGAEIACQTWALFASSSAENEQFGGAVRERWVRDARAAISARAEADGLPVAEYACTFLGAIVRLGVAAHYIQIGDGAIVVHRAGNYECMFWPDQGGFANTTSFLTDPKPAIHTQTNFSVPAVDEIALFSDGLQRLALDYAEKKPFKPFFESMLDVLRPARPEDRAELSQWLEDFLGWGVVNQRTDDDKTLVLASRVRVDGA